MPIDQTLMKGPFIKLDQWAFKCSHKIYQVKLFINNADHDFYGCNSQQKKDNDTASLYANTKSIMDAFRAHGILCQLPLKRFRKTKMIYGFF